jgi:hypothetical protein
MAIRIDNSTVSDRAWGDVDKAALARRLQESGSEATIREAFAYVPDGSASLTTGLENRSEWGGAHHELQGDTLVLNRNGVHALAAALSGARRGVAGLPPVTRLAAARTTPPAPCLTSTTGSSSRINKRQNRAPRSANLPVVASAALTCV